MSDPRPKPTVLRGSRACGRPAVRAAWVLKPLLAAAILSAFAGFGWSRTREGGGEAAADSSSAQPGSSTGLVRPFELAPYGCPMAHCDPGMSDWVRAPFPGAGAVLLEHHPVTTLSGLPMGSANGLGCSSNGQVVACTFGTKLEGYPDQACDPEMQDNLVVYGYQGGALLEKWSSGDLLNCTAYTSAPMVSGYGGVIAADDRWIIRFGPRGSVLWKTPTPGGRPTSSVMTASGMIVLASALGNVAAYDTQTGALVGLLELKEGSERFHTINTPSVFRNRIYISAHHSRVIGRGRLFALDLSLPEGYEPADPSSYDPQETFQVAWVFDFGGPSGASPLVVDDMIYFDGLSLDPEGPFDPHLFAVKDHGDFGEVTWVRRSSNEVRASFAHDRRWGLWFFSYPSKWLVRMARSDLDGDGQGDALEKLDLDALVGEPGTHIPSSAISLAGSWSQPVLLVCATAFGSDKSVISSYVIAIDLNSRSLLWKVELPSLPTAGQFPIVYGPAGARVAFSNLTDGVWVIGTP